MKYDESYFEDRQKIEPHHPLMVEAWLKLFNPQNVLDFGCGSGRLVKLFNDMGVVCDGYDPNVPEFSKKRAKGKYDLVICIDTLEHIKESELPEMLMYIKMLTKRNVLFSICCAGDSNYYLDDTHVTFKSKAWWIAKLSEYFTNVRPAPPLWPYHWQFFIGEVR